MDEIDRYLHDLRDNDENAFFALIRVADSFVPRLIEAYWSESGSSMRAALVEIIWQHRLPTSLGFLAEVLRDDNPEIWKTALDGIVTINQPESREILRNERQRLRAFTEPDESHLGWIDEALTQLGRSYSSTLRDTPTAG